MRKKPAVDVVGTEVLDGCKGAREAGDVLGVGWEGSAFGEEDGGLGLDSAEEGDAAAGLVGVKKPSWGELGD